MKCKNCGEEIESIFYHGHGHNWRHIGTSLFMCMKDRKPIRGHKNYFEAEPISENKEKMQSEKKPSLQGVDPIVHAYSDRFGLSITQPTRLLSPKLCRQLGQCRDDSARRLILGVSH
jgi:hypothetical protein